MEDVIHGLGAKAHVDPERGEEGALVEMGVTFLDLLARRRLTSIDKEAVS